MRKVPPGMRIMSAGGGAVSSRAVMWRLSGDRRSRGRYLGLDRIEVEARAPLHGRELDRRLRQFLHLLLDEHEAPEFVLEPVEVLLRAVLRSAVRPACAFEGIETQVDQRWHVKLRLVAQPTAGLIDEAVFVVVDADGAERAFAEVPDLMPVGLTLAGDQVELVVAVEIHLVG